MTVWKRAAKRDVSEKPIVDTLRKLGWSVHRLSLNGGPDLLIGRNAITLLAEVKTGKGKLKAGQQDWHATWRGFPVIVLRTVEDAVTVTRAQDAGV